MLINLLMIMFLIIVVLYMLTKDKALAIIIKIFISLIGVACTFIAGITFGFTNIKLNPIIKILLCAIIPLLILPTWCKRIRKKLFIGIAIYSVIVIGCAAVNVALIKKDESLKIKTDVNINTYEYMPFIKNSKIARLDHKASLQLKNNLPVLDGAAAVFPVYSAFVNAVYPDTVKYGIEPFLYNNTRAGYKKLAEKETDIFFGAYPSEDQIEYAKSLGTEFEFTEIGREGFVFFVNKDNPVDSLTIDQIKGIYSGRITNWKDVGGKDEEIVAFQRNQGSGSQSMLVRFMGDTPIMQAPTEEVNDFMSGIINQVADYKNYSNSIGFSFRYYLETLIANPNVKMISINGISPSLNNITEGAYPIVTSLYAVTYKENKNENVKLLIDWILSSEGQELIKKTGYAKVK